jgi:hypothetical protein
MSLAKKKTKQTEFFLVLVTGSLLVLGTTETGINECVWDSEPGDPAVGRSLKHYCMLSLSISFSPLFPPSIDECTADHATLATVWWSSSSISL